MNMTRTGTSTLRRKRHDRRELVAHPSATNERDLAVEASSPNPHVLTPLALSLVLVASFMVVLDFSIVNVALPSIRASLGFTGDSVQWVVTAYAITFAGLLILGGRVADLFGRRRCFIVGLLVFAWASLAAGLSPDAMTLIIARAVQGIGAAIVAPASLSLITSRVGEGPRRTRALGLYGATASIGFVAGQVLGGVLVQYWGWASIFLLNVPVGIVAAYFATRVISSDRTRGNMAHLDVVGAVLVTVAVASAVFGVSEGAVLGWAHPLVIAALLVALATSVGFIKVERAHPYPLLQLRLLARANLSSASIITLLMGAWNAGELVVLSLYLQQTLHDSPLVAGLVIAPQGVIGFATGMFGSRLIRRVGMRRLLVTSGISAGLGFLGLIAIPSSGHYGVALLAVVLVGFGTVGSIFGSTVMATAGMADSDQGLVGGVINTTRQVGAALGVAILVAIAEGSHAASGTSSLQGDRLAMFVSACIAFAVIPVAWLGTRAVVARSTGAGGATSLTTNHLIRQGGNHEIHHIG
jgi:EmrB/QacA subfamily drug resistance transporter